MAVLKGLGVLFVSLIGTGILVADVLFLMIKVQPDLNATFRPEFESLVIYNLIWLTLYLSSRMKNKG